MTARDLERHASRNAWLASLALVAGDDAAFDRFIRSMLRAWTLPWIDPELLSNPPHLISA